MSICLELIDNNYTIFDFKEFYIGNFNIILHSEKTIRPIKTLIF
jgi:hypothetical protein